MSDYWPGWLEYSSSVHVALVGAEYRRMQRTDDELRQRDAHLARQRVRFILNRLVRR